jgi:hypothetical protein
MRNELPGWLPDLLDTQYGVLSRAQAIAAGFSSHAVSARLCSGRWQRLYTGVYATFSGEPGRASLLWAAVLRADRHAVLSHLSAAEVWGLIDMPTEPIHVTIPAHARARRIPGVVVHYSSRLRVARHPALSPPRTRVEETVLDLVQSAATAHNAVSWILRSCQRRLTTPGRLRAALIDRNRLRWSADAIAAIRDAESGVHSPLEHRYLHDVEEPHGLPTGSRQAEVTNRGRREYQDVRYRKYRVCVELDGRAAHPDDARWRDIRRDNANAADGLITLRYGWSDVAYRPCEVAAEVARVLRQRGWTGLPSPCGPGCAIRDVA